jgi:hypothetical protein
MTNYAVFSATLGLGLAVSILYLVRRDHLYLRDGLFWIVVATGSLLLGIWPGLVDVLGGALGVGYPPTLFFLIAILVLVLRALLGDIAITRIKRDVRRLNQRMALYEADMPDSGAKPRASFEADVADAVPPSALAQTTRNDAH